MISNRCHQFGVAWASSRRASSSYPSAIRRSVAAVFVHSNLLASAYCRYFSAKRPFLGPSLFQRLRKHAPLVVDSDTEASEDVVAPDFFERVSHRHTGPRPIGFRRRVREYFSDPRIADFQQIASFGHGASLPHPRKQRFLFDGLLLSSAGDIPPRPQQPIRVLGALALFVRYRLAVVRGLVLRPKDKSQNINEKSRVRFQLRVKRHGRSRMPVQQPEIRPFEHRQSVEIDRCGLIRRTPLQLLKE